MRLFHLKSSLWLPRPLDEVFDFFADARNLDLLTPPWLHFEIVTPAPVKMRAGTQIAYRLKLHGIPIRWDSEIAVWEPPHRFVDVQRCGPYRRWVHEHRFSEHDGGTLVSDHVTYAVLGGRLVQRLFVGPDVRRIFAYRRARLSEAARGTGPGECHQADRVRPYGRREDVAGATQDASRVSFGGMREALLAIRSSPTASRPGP
jgi:ligand-binding SRPBCC domain-containing protein